MEARESKGQHTMKRTITAWAAVSAAAILMLAGCSSSVQGAAQAGSTVSTSSSATTSTETSTTGSSQTSTSEETATQSSTSEETATETSEESTSSSSGLDPASEYWFAVFCTQAVDLAGYVSPDTSGQTLGEAQATVVDAYTNISISASTSVGLLQATPAPTFPGGGDLQTDAIASFLAVSDVYGRGALTILALTPTSAADLKAAIDAVEAEAKASIPEKMADVDPAILDKAKTLPECQGVLGG